MLPPAYYPVELSQIHPWIAGLLTQDEASAAGAISTRLSDRASPETAPLASMAAMFTPCRIEFCSGVGYVLCVRNAVEGGPNGNVTDQLYIAEPLPEKAIQKRVKFFDNKLRPLMTEFLSKYAGCGEEMEGASSGQFVLRQDEPPSAFYDPETVGEWNDAQLLYTARSGDTLWINKWGATAWGVMELQEIIPLFDSFPELLRHYAEFRVTNWVFDSWSSRDFAGHRPWGDPDASRSIGDTIRLFRRAHLDGLRILGQNMLRYDVSTRCEIMDALGETRKDLDGEPLSREAADAIEDILVQGLSDLAPATVERAGAIVADIAARALTTRWKQPKMFDIQAAPATRERQRLEVKKAWLKKRGTP